MTPTDDCDTGNIVVLMVTFVTRVKVVMLLLVARAVADNEIVNTNCKTCGPPRLPSMAGLF